MRISLFPVTTRIEKRQNEPRLTIAGLDLVDLAEKYGTPLYLYDRETLDQSLTAYRSALKARYPHQSRITYAGKAFLCTAIASWAFGQELWIDCAGASEMYIAQAGGGKREQILVHGVNKSPADLVAAVAQAGTIVVDNLTELERLAILAQNTLHPLPKLWLRLQPGVPVETHVFTKTGQEDSKFGMDPETFLQAVRFSAENNLPVEGIHFHLGSSLRDVAPLETAIRLALDLAARARAETGWTPSTLSPGGGWGVPYNENELPYPSVDDYIAAIAGSLQEGCRSRDLPLPLLQIEPGRSLVARAGVALYRVGTVKKTRARRWLLLDGGMADNPRHALYRACYSALPVLDPERPDSGAAWLAGPYCESGDVLIEELPLPDIQTGELIAVPVSGAYQISMSSNYNGACRPAVLWLEAGTERLILRRETPEDLLRRDEIHNL